MNFEQNNSFENELLESDETRRLSSSQEVLNADLDILEEELTNLKDQDDKENNEELARIRASLNNVVKNSEQENIFELKIKENETDFNFLGRLSKFLIDKQEDQDNKNNPNSNKNIVKLSKKRNHQIRDVYQDEDNQDLIKQSFLEATKSINKKEVLDNDGNISRLNNINISSGSRTMNWDLNKESEHQDKVDFFSKTNQERSFFPSHYKNDGAYYSGSLFNVHSDSPEAREYLKNKLDDKVIYLLGGGKSVNDLLKDTQINPKQIINIDPFISKEGIERNQKGVYRSISERADSDKLIEEIKEQKVKLADEIWASYSVPYYNESEAEINNLFSNIKQLLKEGGNCRITPITAQNEGANQAVLNNLKQIIYSKEYNIHVHENTLIIHKLENKN